MSETQLLVPPIGDSAWTALVSAVTSVAVTLVANRLQVRDKLRIEYEYEQRKHIRELMGRYHGRLLQSANLLSKRFFNLYTNQSKGWLRIARGQSEQGYYLFSTVYRFLQMCSLCRLLEREAIYLDARIAKPEDQFFLKLSHAITYSITDVSLFAGLEYDAASATDHLFADDLRMACDAFCCGAETIDQATFRDRMKKTEEFMSVFHFFDGLEKMEERNRWDRVVTLHLLLVIFVNKFGYSEQKCTPQHISLIIDEFQQSTVAINLLNWLPKLGLDRDAQVSLITRAVKQRFTLR